MCLVNVGSILRVKVYDFSGLLHAGQKGSVSRGKVLVVNGFAGKKDQRSSFVVGITCGAEGSSSSSSSS